MEVIRCILFMFPFRSLIFVSVDFLRNFAQVHPLLCAMYYVVNIALKYSHKYMFNLYEYLLVNFGYKYICYVEAFKPCGYKLNFSIRGVSRAKLYTGMLLCIVPVS